MDDVAVTHEESAFERLAERVVPGSRLLRTWIVTGGVSAQITALEIERSDGGTAKLIARRHGHRDLKSNLHIARDEFRLLEIAKSHGLAAPKPYYVDESCELFPTPVLVVEFVEGETEFEPDDLQDFLTQMAAQLVRIHEVSDSPELAFLPRRGQGFGERPAIVDEAMGEGRIRDALESARPVAQVNGSVLLHGDFWGGNVLWQDGRLASVIDWEDAAVGDPLSDLGSTRLETLWAFGFDAMQRFTDLYRSMTGIDLTNLPYWDLIAALRPCSRISEWGLDDATEAQMKDKHARFVGQAIQRLNGRRDGAGT